MKQLNQSEKLKVITAEIYHSDPDRYELRRGSEEGAPSCPFGNAYEWIGYDLEKNEYVRFTKSVFKKLVVLQNQ